MRRLLKSHSSAHGGTSARWPALPDFFAVLSSKSFAFSGNADNQRMISWRFTLMQSWKSKCASFWFQSTTFLIEILGSMRNCCKEKMVVRNFAAVAQMVARGVQMTWARQFPAVYFAPMMMMVVESWMIVFSWFIFQDQVYISTIRSSWYISWALQLHQWSTSSSSSLSLMRLW